MCLVSFTNRLNMFLAKKKKKKSSPYARSDRNRLKVQSEIHRKGICREDIFVVKGREPGRILTVINVHRWRGASLNQCFANMPLGHMAPSPRKF